MSSNKRIFLNSYKELFHNQQEKYLKNKEKIIFTDVLEHERKKVPAFSTDRESFNKIVKSNFNRTLG